MTVEDILNKYSINYNLRGNYYYINGVPHYITFAQQVNNEPDNLRIQTANKHVQSVIKTHLDDKEIRAKIWVLIPEEKTCKVAEFYEALDDDTLLNGNKSLKFKKSEFKEPGTVVSSQMLYNAKLFHLYNDTEPSFDDLNINIQPESDIYVIVN